MELFSMSTFVLKNTEPTAKGKGRERGTDIVDIRAEQPAASEPPRDGRFIELQYLSRVSRL
jgi:hypothetical protein